MRFMEVLSPQKWTTLCWINELIKEIINLRGEEKTVCSNHWHCLGTIQLTLCPCDFILYGFRVNFSTSLPAETFTYWFIGPLLFSQQRQVVCQAQSFSFILLPGSSEKKISKPYEPIIGCISPQGGMLQWVISESKRYLSPWQHEVYKYTNCSTIAPFLFLAEASVLYFEDNW